MFVCFSVVPLVSLLWLLSIRCETQDDPFHSAPRHHPGGRSTVRPNSTACETAEFCIHVLRSPIQCPPVLVRVPDTSNQRPSRVRSSRAKSTLLSPYQSTPKLRFSYWVRVPSLCLPVQSKRRRILSTSEPKLFLLTRLYYR
jgi:hypothetical protein